jgi:hypothetical protein
MPPPLLTTCPCGRWTSAKTADCWPRCRTLLAHPGSPATTRRFRSPTSSQLSRSPACSRLLAWLAAFSPGQRTLVTRHQDGRLREIDAATGAVLRRFDGPGVEGECGGHAGKVMVHLFPDAGLLEVDDLGPRHRRKRADRRGRPRAAPVFALPVSRHPKGVRRPGQGLRGYLSRDGRRWVRLLGSGAHDPRDS